MAALVGLLLLGTAGFGLLEGMGALDALYMAVITLSTVGFGEVRPLSPGGKFFTIGLILGVGWLAMYLLGGLADFLLSGEGRAYWQKRRLLRMLDKLSDHVIVCGYGRVGRHVARELAAQGLPFVVIDPLPEKISQVGQTLEQCRWRARFGVTVLACKLADGGIDASPTADTELTAGLRMIVLGTREQLQSLPELAQGKLEAF